MPKLTDTQLVILSAAAQRHDGAVQPLPNSLKLEGGAVATTLKSLLSRKLIAEQAATRDAAVWRETTAGERLMLVITDAGRKAIGVESEGKSTVQRSHKAPSKGKHTQAKKTPPRSKPRGTPSPAAARSRTKQSLLVDLLSRRQGATVSEVVKATGWQSHSVRGAISGSLKKKFGLHVASEKVEGRGRVYRVIAGR
jgi:hypothetical protein